MRQVPAQIQALIEPVVKAMGYELVGIEYLAQGRHSLLRVYIDVASGITLDDCERVSHQLSGVLDVEDVITGQYNLEVSSPGLDRPLFTEEQFQRFVGEQANIRLATPVNGRRKFQGEILGSIAGNVRLKMDDEEILLPLSAIEKANLVPNL